MAQRDAEKKYELKTRVIGLATAGHLNGESQQIRVLNRIVRGEKDGVSYEPDPRHAEIIAMEMGVDGTKGVVTPSIKEAIGGGR